MNREFVGILAGLALAAATPAPAVDVLLLVDAGSEEQVSLALEAAGHVVTDGGLYYLWDGVTPNVADFQFVVLLDGYDYGYDLTPGALAALQGFVADGCGLLVSEWTTYDVYYAYKSAEFGLMLPTESPAGDYGYADDWAVIAPGHPLVAGVPATWTDLAGWSVVTARAGTQVVVEGSTGNPLYAWWRWDGDGAVLHLNHDLTYTTATIEPNALQLIVNAVSFGACLPYGDGFEAGDTRGWSATVP